MCRHINRKIFDKCSKSPIQLLNRSQMLVLSSLTLGLVATKAQLLEVALAVVAGIFALTYSYIVLYFVSKAPTRLFEPVEQRMRWTESPRDDYAGQPPAEKPAALG